MSDRVVFPWNRYWFPLSGTVSLADRGFLVNPEEECARYVKSDAVTFDDIAEIPCLALLGEPGSGKSTAMEAARESLWLRASECNEAFVWKNLNEVMDGADLIDSVFGSDEFRAWLGGGHTLSIFLDSLDECRLLIPNVANILGSFEVPG